VAAARLNALLLNFGIMFAQKAGHHLPYHISGGAVSLLASTTIFFAISLLSKPKKLLPLVEAAMDV
jgi:hypothetical protein